MQTDSTNTLKKLILLISIFTIGLVLLVNLRFVFLELEENLDKKTENLKAKMLIGEFVVNDLYKIRSDFYELATTVTNKRGRELIKKRIDKRILDIQESLKVLKDGGKLKKTIRLNVEGHNDTTRIISYIKDENTIALEVIDLVPKLEEFRGMVASLMNLLKEQSVFRRTGDLEKFLAQNKKIKRFYKSTPAFFIRTTENANRLLYEGNIELKNLEKQVKAQKRQYTLLELTLIATILILVIFLGFIISSQINKSSKKLVRQERFTRGILDAQDNIVIVSNGDEMIDANKALIDFFDGFNSFEDFRKDHICICDFFEDIGKENYLLDIDYDGLEWFEYIFENPHLPHKVAMKGNKEINHFSISAVKKELDSKNFIVIVVLNNITREIKAQEELKILNENLGEIVEDKTKELILLNENLEQKVKKEVAQNREKDKTLIQQSRFAALGEMIGNIAHQWRQPLSAISSTVSSMQLQRTLNLASEEDIDKSYTSILKYVEFLTQTIEDFRSFFREDKEKIEFEITKVIKNAVSITSATYKANSICLSFDYKKDKKYLSTGFPNELTQVFLNILGNAKDILIEKEVETKIVKIEIMENKDSNIIKIFDNAGGIKEEIKEKIFDPYFTTKHKAQGTGIGLYMSKNIVEKHMKGTLQVENSSFEYIDEKHFGACFIVKLPKI